MLNGLLFGVCFVLKYLDGYQKGEREALRRKNDWKARVAKVAPYALYRCEQRALVWRAALVQEIDHGDPQ